MYCIPIAKLFVYTNKEKKVTKYNNKSFIFSNEISTAVIILEVTSLLKH